jgi:hypothetical protein
MGGRHFILFMLSYLVFDYIHEICWAAQPWYLGQWANEYDNPDILEVPVVK